MDEALWPITTVMLTFSGAGYEEIGGRELLCVLKNTYHWDGLEGMLGSECSMDLDVGITCI